MINLDRRWHWHGAVLGLLALAPLLFVFKIAPLPPWAARDSAALGVLYGMALASHGFISSLVVGVLRPRALGTVGVHAGILALATGLAALVALR